MNSMPWGLESKALALVLSEKEGTGKPNEIQSTETQAVSCLELAHNLVGCIKIRLKTYLLTKLVKTLNYGS
ncbi:hypothetical protein BGP_0437 [Beggiatoa sp. PS]|nr:hypothetical protein BGP_0437 [Beggiatoa sp. PS]